MRFTHIDLNFDIRYEGHQNCPKILSMNILRVFSDHHFWRQNWHQYLWTSLCQFNFFVNLLHSLGVWFLGGLSLHLNHLIAERVSAPYRQFGTLPIEIFLSNLDSGQLETSLMTSYCHFWNLSTFGDSRAVWVFWPKLGVFRKSKFSRWRSNRALMLLGGF